MGLGSLLQKIGDNFKAADFEIKPQTKIKTLCKNFKANFGSGGKPCVLRIDFLQSKKKVFHVRYASQLGSEVFYFGIERFGRGIG